MTHEQQKWIDGAPYEDLLAHWEHAPIGDPLCSGECGKYLMKMLGVKQMEEKQRKLASRPM